MIYANSDEGLLLAFNIHWSGRTVKGDAAAIHSFDAKAAGLQYCVSDACPCECLALLKRAAL